MRRTFLFLLGGLAAGFAAFGITTLVLQMDDAGAQGEPRVEERVETLDAAEARSGMDVATPLVVPEEFERTGIFVSALLDGAAATEVSQWWASPADGDSGMLLIQTPATGSLPMEDGTAIDLVPGRSAVVVMYPPAPGREFGLVEVQWEASGSHFLLVGSLLGSIDSAELIRVAASTLSAR